MHPVHLNVEMNDKQRINRIKLIVKVPWRVYSYLLFDFVLDKTNWIWVSFGLNKSFSRDCCDCDATQSDKRPARQLVSDAHALLLTVILNHTAEEKKNKVHVSWNKAEKAMKLVLFTLQNNTWLRVLFCFVVCLRVLSGFSFNRSTIPVSVTGVSVQHMRGVWRWWR